MAATTDHELGFGCSRGLLHTDPRTLETRGHVEMHLQDMHNVQGLLWPLWSIIDQVLFSSAAEVRFMSAMSKFNIAVGCFTQGAPAKK